jgi:spore coat protein CotH
MMSLKLKRYYPVTLALLIALSFFTFVLGDQRVIAYTVKAESQSTEEKYSDGIDITNEIDLFDDTVVHSIQIIMSDEDYDTMITTYQETGLKEYFQADIVIDGVQINDVGIRLKGNASLRTALGGGGGMGGGQNTLVTRFMANATFKALYEEKLQLIYQQAFVSGAMTEIV